VPIVLKSGSLNHLEPSGPLKACNGIALPVISIIFMRGIYSYIPEINPVSRAGNVANLLLLLMLLLLLLGRSRYTDSLQAGRFGV
jgi:hypothetical protein